MNADSISLSRLALRWLRALASGVMSLTNAPRIQPSGQSSQRFRGPRLRHPAQKRARFFIFMFCSVFLLMTVLFLCRSTLTPPPSCASASSGLMHPPRAPR